MSSCPVCGYPLKILKTGDYLKYSCPSCHYTHLSKDPTPKSRGPLPDHSRIARRGNK